ncbi:MAG TPA: phosphodiesterase [Rhodocyclaceae bacterium]
MLIAQLSDPHILAAGQLLYRRFDSAAALRDAVSRIGKIKPHPDCVVVSGDLVNHGAAAEYAQLRDLLAPLTMPVFLMPGNHDERGALATAFAGDDRADKLRQAFTGAPLCCQRVDLAPADGEVLTLLLLDTVIPGREGGEVGAAQLDWLEANCPADAPTMLFLHHPPFSTGIAGMDAITCSGAGLLADWLAAHRNVIALSSGHVHRTIFTRFAGIAACIAPSTALQIALDLGGKAAALSWTPEPGGFLLHHWHEQSLVTHLVPSAAVEVVRYGA